MSVIAFDGKIIAADKQATNGDMKVAVTKLVRHPRSGGSPLFIGWTGPLDGGLMLHDWYLDGAKKESWPKIQETDDWCRLIVFDGDVFFYERLPVKMRTEHPFMAFGSGRDFAMGAMSAGKNAVEAVEIASSLCDSCGCGVNWFKVEKAGV